MASSIYIYETEEDFNNFYGKNKEDITRNLKIIDMFIHDKEKLWVVTNTNNLKERPELVRSLVHFRNGNIDEYKTENTKLVEYEKMTFNFKKNKLEFFPRLLRKPLLSWRVDRYIGNKVKKVKINYVHRYYDYKRDRLNFVLKTNAD